MKSSNDNILKCPNCGEPINASWKICPACEILLAQRLPSGGLGNVSAGSVHAVGDGCGLDCPGSARRMTVRRWQQVEEGGHESMDWTPLGARVREAARLAAAVHRAEEAGRSGGASAELRLSKPDAAASTGAGQSSR